MLESSSEDEQIELRKYLDVETYYQDIAQIYINNPFFHLTPEELGVFLKSPNASPLRKLIVAREAAARSEAARYAVFCMPKSGSSFVKSALQHALEVPFVSLTSFTNPRISAHFGMNSREQEIDELGLTKSILCSPNGFVSQHHTRYSMYLALQMKFFGITPIVTIRNVLDCIVSFDEMMMTWRRETPDESWITDAQFPLPLGYQTLDPEVRYGILARSFGIWLIGFFLSWKRCARQAVIDPLVIRFEDDILDHPRLIETLRSGLSLSESQHERLAGYVDNPDRVRSRFNVGVTGRGRERLPERVKTMLLDFANAFAEEISPDEIRYLVT